MTGKKPVAEQFPLLQPTELTGPAAIARQAFSRRLFVLGGTAAIVGFSKDALAEPQKKSEPTPAKKTLTLKDDAQTGGAIDLSVAKVEPASVRNRLVLELKGQLTIRDQLTEGRKNPERSVDIEAKSTLDYEENHDIVDGRARPAGSLRFYHEAKVENIIAKHATSTELSKAIRRIVARWDADEVIFHSPDGPLSSAELDLLQVPCCSLALSELLPSKPISVGETFEVPQQALPTVFALAAVHSADIKGKLERVESNLAYIDLVGQLDGTAANVPTHLDIEGKIQVDLKDRLITWVAMKVQEKRKVSQVEPGFDVTARIRLVRKPTEVSPDVQDLSLVTPSSNDLDGLTLVRFESTAGRYQLLSDRRWKVIHDAGDVAILRMIENDRVIAQCNLHKLTKLDAGQQITLEAFQEEVRETLDKNFRSIATAEERITESGLRVLRVVAMGDAEELPVQWMYHHLSDDTGRRLSLVFTVSSEFADKVAESDAQMVSSLTLLPELPPATTKPAAANAEVSKLQKSKESSPAKR